MTPALDTQIASFLARLPDQADPLANDEPQVIFRGALELTREQETAMVDHLLKRMGELEDELGRKDADQAAPVWTRIEDGGELDVEGMSFMARRTLWDLIFHQRFEWRRRLWAGIFAAGQNLHIPMTRRTVQQMIARAQNHFFAAEPFCTATPVGIDDIDVATTCNEWVQYKFKQGRIKLAGMKSIELAGIRGECVMETRHRVDRQDYGTIASVLIGPDGEPVVAADNDCIYEDDTWHVDDETGVLVLDRDGETPQPHGGLRSSMFRQRKVRRSIVRQRGPEARPVAFKDFLAPLNAESLQTADTLVHFEDITAIEIAGQFIERLQAARQWDPGQYPRTLEFLRTAASNQHAGTTAADAVRPELGESVHSTPMHGRGDPVVRTAKFFARYDADNDGRLEDVFVVVDLDTKRPILYDHVANVFPGGRRPYHPVVWWPVEGRWHGMGAVETFWQLQKFIDLCMNRWELSESQAGSKTFFNPELTVEGQNNPKLDVNSPGYLRKRDVNVPASRILERVPLHEFKGQNLDSLIDRATQIFVNMSGVGNGNDAAAAGLDTSQLATGINNIQQSGEEMFTPLLVNLEDGITTVATECQVLAVEHMDEEEAFAIVGSNGLAALKKLKASQVQKLQWNVSLEVSSNRSQRDVAQLTAAKGAAVEYLGLPPPNQATLAPLYRQLLKLYGVRDVDKILPLPTQGAVDQHSTTPGLPPASPSPDAPPADPTNNAPTASPPQATNPGAASQSNPPPAPPQPQQAPQPTNTSAA